MPDNLTPGMSILRLPLLALTPHESNPRNHPEHQLLTLIRSLQTHGQQRPVVITPEHVILAGHGLVQAAKRLGWDAIDCVIYSGPNPEAFLLMDNQSSLYAYDDTDKMLAMLRDLLAQEVPLEDAGFDTEEVTNLLHDIDAPTPAPEGAAKVDDLLGDEEDDNPEGLLRPPDLTSHDVPDALWATDNQWDIPVLLPQWQADALDLPVNKWGVGRKIMGSGTIHFYTQDMKFEYLWKNPQGLINYGCVNAVEPNFSTNAQMPKALVLYQTYRKRWMARYWQSKGIRIFVDLHVIPEWEEMNLLGVPRGWRAYASKGLVAQQDTLLPLFKTAQAHAEREDILFVVIGGRDSIKELCLQHGWVHVPEHQQLVHGKVTGGTLAKKTSTWDSKKNKRKKKAG